MPTPSALPSAPTLQVKTMIDQGADVNARAVGGSTTMHEAAFKGDLPTVKILLENGANPVAPKDDGFTPMLFACLRGHFAVAQAIASVAGGSILMNDVSGLSPFVAAVVGGNVELVKWLGDLLKQQGGSLTSRTQCGSSATHHAVWSNQPDVLRHLLESFPDLFGLDDQRNDGDTILHVSAKRGSTVMASEALRRGCGTETKNRDGFTPLLCACWHKQTAVAVALIQAKVDIEATAPNHSTALHFAAWHGDSKLMLKLIESGANTSARTRDGDTPLHQAVFGNRA